MLTCLLSVIVGYGPGGLGGGVGAGGKAGYPTGTGVLFLLSSQSLGSELMGPGAPSAP